MMTLVALILSLFVAALGALGVASPSRLLDVVRCLQTPGGVYLAAGIRVVFGVALFIAAAPLAALEAVRTLGKSVHKAGRADRTRHDLPAAARRDVVPSRRLAARLRSVGQPEMKELAEYVPGRIWLREYPVRYAGTRFSARMTVLRLASGKLLIHSPCGIDDSLHAEISGLGEVSYLVAPGTYHHLYIEPAQARYPNAQTYICPGIERKRPGIRFDWILGDRSPPEWADEVEQVLVHGARFVSEVAMFDRSTRTLLLVDLIENIGDRTPGTDWALRAWWKFVTHMWNRAAPAPEYQIGWGAKKIVGAALSRILAWDFERVVIAHGDLIEHDAKPILRSAWARPLRAIESPPFLTR